MTIPDNITKIIEPFTGNGDLIMFIERGIKQYDIECYDIEPKRKFIIQRDTLLYPPLYENKYIITNPPYLARNKLKDKKLFDKYGVNDLYKCLIKELITNKCIGGMLIIPLNFWSSIRVNDIELRKKFLDVYDIILLNIFEEQVFEDTTYTICSFQFELKKLEINKLNIVIYPSKTKILTELNENNNYIIGGHIYNLIYNNNYKITRLTSKNIKSNYSNILVKCIDDNTDNKIKLTYVNNDDIYSDNTPNQTSRTYATLIIEPYIDKNKQLKLVDNFNSYLNDQRDRYNSLFLTNYREGCRKRISFDLVYSICCYLLEKIDKIMM
jgi:hypothetical protein